MSEHRCELTMNVVSPNFNTTVTGWLNTFGQMLVDILKLAYS
jgi:hypothetical protein